MPTVVLRSVFFFFPLLFFASVRRHPNDNDDASLKKIQKTVILTHKNIRQRKMPGLRSSWFVRKDFFGHWLTCFIRELAVRAQWSLREKSHAHEMWTQHLKMSLYLLVKEKNMYLVLWKNTRQRMHNNTCGKDLYTGHCRWISRAVRGTGQNPKSL